MPSRLGDDDESSDEERRSEQQGREEFEEQKPESEDAVMEGNSGQEGAGSESEPEGYAGA